MSNFSYKTTSTPVRGKKFTDLLKQVKEGAFRDAKNFQRENKK